jgi:hypothetical protein
VTKRIAGLTERRFAERAKEVATYRTRESESQMSPRETETLSEREMSTNPLLKQETAQ